MVKFLEDNKVILEKQFEFKESLSTKDAIGKLVHNISTYLEK